jgi:hypothetical protein
MTNVSTNYLSFLPLVSRIGADARVLPIPALDFSKDSGYQIDLTATIQSAQLSHPIQTLWVDSSSCLAGPTVIQIFGTGQLLSIPAQMQGYIAVMCTNTFIFTLVNTHIPIGALTANSLFNISFLNVPFVSGLWASNILVGYGN